MINNDVRKVEADTVDKIASVADDEMAEEEEGVDEEDSHADEEEEEGDDEEDSHADEDETEREEECDEEEDIDNGDEDRSSEAERTDVV